MGAPSWGLGAAEAPHDDDGDGGGDIYGGGVYTGFFNCLKAKMEGYKIKKEGWMVGRLKWRVKWLEG